MTARRVCAIALALFLVVGASVAAAQIIIQQGQAVAPDAPKIVLLHAPKKILPARNLPVYLSVKAGEANLKEIVWSFENPPYSDEAFGSYRIKPGEEKEVTGHFVLSTFDALRSGTLSNATDLLVYIKIWARDVQERSSQIGYFEVILDPLASKEFPPPNMNLNFAKNFGIIEGRIVPPIGDSSRQ
ncbi:MAG: hypothetical protein ACE5JS_10630 [Nitrospinota bacterium]